MGTHDLHKEKVREFVSRRLYAIDKSRVDLSKEIGKSLSYISQVESGLVNFSSKLAASYCLALNLDAEQKSEFEFRVRTSNARRKATNSTHDGKSISALLSVAADDLPAEAIRQIEDIVYKSVGAS